MNLFKERIEPPITVDKKCAEAGKKKGPAKNRIRPTSYHVPTGVLAKLLAMLVFAAVLSTVQSDISIPINKEPGSMNIAVESNKTFTFVLHPPNEDCFSDKQGNKYNVTLNYPAKSIDSSTCGPLVIEWDRTSVKIGNESGTFGHETKEVLVFTFSMGSKIQSVVINEKNEPKFLSYECLPVFQSNEPGKWYFKFSYTPDTDDSGKCATTIDIIGASEYVLPTPAPTCQQSSGSTAKVPAAVIIVILAVFSWYHFSSNNSTVISEPVDTNFTQVANDELHEQSITDVELDDKHMDSTEVDISVE